MTTAPQIPPRPDRVPPRPIDVGTGAGRPTATWSWYEAIGVYGVAFLLAGVVTVPLLGSMPDTDTTAIVVTIAAAFVMLGVVLLWLWRAHPRWPRVMGLPPPEGYRREVGAGVLFGVGLYPVMVVVVGGILVALLELLSDHTVRVPEQVGSELSPLGLVFTVAYAFVIAPLGEELFFRGVLFRTLRDRHGFWVGALGSGSGFGLIHYIPGPAIDAALLMIVMAITGMALCLLYERRGTIVAPVAAHVTFNVVGLTLILWLR